MESTVDSYEKTNTVYIYIYNSLNDSNGLRIFKKGLRFNDISVNKL